MVIFRCSLQWKTLLADRTPLFDRIIATMGSQVEAHQEENGVLAYWLSNAVTLFYLMQKNTKPASGSSVTQRLRQQGQLATRGLFSATKGGFSSFFSRTGYGQGSPGGEASIHGGGAGGLRQVEAKYPALLFKQQLDAFVQKIFPMLRDNVKREITPLLMACIHAPRQGGARAGPRRTVSGPDSRGEGQPHTPGGSLPLYKLCRSGCNAGVVECEPPLSWPRLLAAAVGLRLMGGGALMIMAMPLQVLGPQGMAAWVPTGRRS